MSLALYALPHVYNKPSPPPHLGAVMSSPCLSLFVFFFKFTEIGELGFEPNMDCFPSQIRLYLSLDTMVILISNLLVGDNFAGWS